MPDPSGSSSGFPTKGNPLPPGEFSGGHEVAVAGDQHDLIDLPLVGEGGDVQRDPHIDALLPGGEGEVVVGQAEEIHRATRRRPGTGRSREQAAEPILADAPRRIPLV